MTVILGICAVAITAAFVAVAIAAMRSMDRFGKTADELAKTSEAIRSSLDQVDGVTREFHELAESLQSVVPTVRGVVGRFGEIGERTARLSSTVLDEVEGPIRRAVALIHGVRIGTNTLMNALSHRARSNAAINGGES
jgi:uncharacterized protein YoxC